MKWFRRVDNFVRETGTRVNEFKYNYLVTPTPPRGDSAPTGRHRHHVDLVRSFSTNQKTLSELVKSKQANWYKNASNRSNNPNPNPNTNPNPNPYPNPNPNRNPIPKP